MMGMLTKALSAKVKVEGMRTLAGVCLNSLAMKKTKTQSYPSPNNKTGSIT